MKKKIIIIIILILIILLSFYLIIRYDKKGFYTIKGDNIVTIDKIVGNRNLTKKKISLKNGLLNKTYEYKDVKDPYTDLSLYIKELKNKSNFLITKKYDLNKEKDTISLTRYSTNKEYIIIMTINYNKDSYSINIVKGKGTITTP